MTTTALTQAPNVTPLSLAQHLARLPDTRHRQGQRHSLAAILNLVAVAVLCGMRGLRAIAQFGRALSPHDTARLGFTHPVTPCPSTLSEVLRDIDPGDLESELRAWARGQARNDDHLALDGKALNGSGDGDVPAVHLLALYATASGVAVAQAAVGDKTNEHKAALDFLRQVPLAGRVITADAMFTHRDFCDVVRDGGGDYVLPAKDNQPTLRRDVEAVFTPDAGLSPPPASGDGRGSSGGVRGDQGARPGRATNADDLDAVE